SNNTFFFLIFFFSHATSPCSLYSLSLHDALPISISIRHRTAAGVAHPWTAAGLHTVESSNVESSNRRYVQRRSPNGLAEVGRSLDRKSTRLNSSHLVISYAVFCLKKKKKN